MTQAELATVENSLSTSSKTQRDRIGCDRIIFVNWSSIVRTQTYEKSDPNSCGVFRFGLFFVSMGVLLFMTLFF